MSVNPIYLLSGFGMILVGVFFILYWFFFKKISFSFFLWGALAWIVAVLLKAAVSYSVTNNLVLFLRLHLPKYFAESLIWIYVGLMTGIFECGVVLLFTFIRRLRDSNYKEAIGIGIGFGSVEAILLGASSFITLLVVLLIPAKLPKDFINQIFSSLQPISTIFAPILERFSAMLIHISSTVLIIISVKLKKQGWFWLSFLYKTIVDGYAGYLIFTKGAREMVNVMNYYSIEFVFLALGLIGILILIKIKKFFND